MIKVFITSPFTAEEIPELRPELLPPYRREKILRCKSPKAAQESFVAGLLLRYVLSTYGISQKNIRAGKNGKPECDGIYFNLAHSHGRALCAVGGADVGCDIEQIRKAPLRIAKRFFSTAENAFLEEKKTDEDFFRIWTAKESYIKMTGDGLQLPLDSFSAVHGGRIGFEAVDGIFFREFKTEAYRVAVCAREEIENKLHLVDVESLSAF